MHMHACSRFPYRKGGLGKETPKQVAGSWLRQVERGGEECCCQSFSHVNFCQAASPMTWRTVRTQKLDKLYLQNRARKSRTADDVPKTKTGR